MAELTKSHDTILIGWDKSGNIVFFKGYFYDFQKDEAHKDLKNLQESGYNWQIGRANEVIDKADKWDSLENKIGKFYDPEYEGFGGLEEIGEISAHAFGFL